MVLQSIDLWRLNTLNAALCNHNHKSLSFHFTNEHYSVSGSRCEKQNVVLRFEPLIESICMPHFRFTCVYKKRKKDMDTFGFLLTYVHYFFADLSYIPINKKTKTRKFRQVCKAQYKKNCSVHTCLVGSCIAWTNLSESIVVERIASVRPDLNILSVALS